MRDKKISQHKRTERNLNREILNLTDKLNEKCLKEIKKEENENEIEDLKNQIQNYVKQEEENENKIKQLKEKEKSNDKKCKEMKTKLEKLETEKEKENVKNRKEKIIGKKGSQVRKEAEN